MTKLEIIKEMELLETKRLNLEKLKEDVCNHYTESMNLIVLQEGRNFNKKYDGESIPINLDIFADYLDREIGGVEKKLNDLVKKLSNGTPF